MLCPSSFLISLLLLANVPDPQPLDIKTPRLTARFRCGFLLELRDRRGTVYVRPADATPGLGIHRISGEHHAGLSEGPSTLADRSEVRRQYGGFSGLEGAKAQTTYRAAAEEELVLTQSATSPQPGVWGVSWSIGRIPLEYAVIVPGRSGIRLTADSPGRRHQFDYPIGWEAQLVVIAFHAVSLPDDVVCAGVVAQDGLAILRTRSRSNTVLDLAEQIDWAVCGSKPYSQAGREWKGPGSADDGGGFTDSSGGVLAAHPPWKTEGSGIAYARYQVDLPRDGRVVLTSGVALAEGAEQPGRSDGVTFRISATDGNRQWKQEIHHASETPQTLQLDLTPLAGKKATVELAVEPGPKRSPSFDWARWLQPRVEKSGQREAAVAFAGSGACALAVDSQGERPILRDGASLRTDALLPGSVFLLREPPQAVRLPLDLAAQPRTVMFLDDSGRELTGAEHAAIRPEPFAEDGQRKPGLFAHPPNHGQTLAHFPMRLPAEPARFTCRVGLREGSRSEGVLFIVEANGRELARQRMTPGPWQPLSLDLSPWTDRAVVLSLITDSDGPFSFDWACWCEPKIE
ncbi:MAG: hypothetical protein HUU20_09265 [Pirellulales bacterium]|nr:hypothetical protein [Pirellulales bacterium]